MLSWSSTSGSDPGGQIELWQANTPLIEEATLFDTAAWALNGTFEPLEPGYYWLSEVGNGTDYAGRSTLAGPYQCT